MDSLAAVDWTAYETGSAEPRSPDGAARRRARPLSRPEVRAGAGASRRPRPRDRDAAERRPRDGSRTAVGAREQELERAARQAAAESGIDVTIPGSPVTRGRLHLLTQIRREIEDIFLGMGYEVWDGAEVVDRLGELRRAHDRAAGPPVAIEARDVLPRRRHRAAHAHLARPDQGDADAEAADLHGVAGPLLPARHAGRDALADVPAGRVPRRRPRHHPG